MTGLATTSTFRTNWSGPLMVAAGGVCIGFAPIGLRLGLGELGPQAIALWRYLFALPVLFLIVLVAQRRLPTRPNRFVLIAGTCFALDMGLWHAALTFTSVANATFIVNLGNIGVGFAAWIFLREALKPVWVFAVILAVVGAAALSFGSQHASDVTRPFALRGDLLALGAAVLVSGYMLASKLARRTLGGLETIFWLTMVEACVATLLVTLSGEAFLPAELAGFSAPLFLALIVQVCGQGLIVTGLGHTPASLAGVLVVIQPVVAAFLSWHLFGEILLPLQIGGAVLILAAILIAQMANRRPVSPLSQSSTTSFID